jgi:thymidylate kinase
MFARNSHPPRRPPVLISFSGIDGCGKSTQIERISEELSRHGYRVVRLAFWDDVVTLRTFREGVTLKVFKSQKGIGAPGKPVRRRDKNVRAWYLSLLRAAMYFLDTLHLRRVVRGERLGADVIIFDRYIYDELANLPLANMVARAYVRLLAALAPQPDVAFLMDADPEEACARKPEYPVEFTRHCRETYLRLSDMVALTVIPPGKIEEAQQRVKYYLSQQLSLAPVPAPTQLRSTTSPEWRMPA